MAYSKTFLLLGLVFAVVLLLSSEVSALNEDRHRDHHDHHGHGDHHGKPGHGAAGRKLDETDHGHGDHGDHHGHHGHHGKPGHGF